MFPQKEEQQGKSLKTEIIFVGQALYVLWMTASFFITTFFCQNLRSLMILPDVEPPIEDHYRDIQHDSVKIALDFGKFSSTYKATQ